MNAVEHIGKRIRLYRKQNNMTIDDLSAKLHLSPSTISKYENGKIAMDIETLFYIAKVLDIDINMLVDYQESVNKGVKDPFEDNFFKRSNLFYVYRYTGIEKRIFLDVIEIKPCEKERYDNVMVYLCCASEEQYAKCSKLFQGRIYYSDSSATLTAASKIRADGFLSAYFTSNLEDYSFGLGTTNSDLFKKPYSTKLIASVKPLERNKELRELLKINSKTTISSIKELNMLCVE